VFRGISHVAIAAALLAVPVGMAGAAQASATSTTTKTTTTSRAAAIRDCINVTNREVGRGDSGNYVKEVQCLLNWAIRPATYHPIAEDGEFGADTEGKVYKFQRCYNAKPGADIGVDGRVGPQTWPKLEDWAEGTTFIC
jgi:zinc D-Ala-D-Ala carboxypeptidase